MTADGPRATDNEGSKDLAHNPGFEALVTPHSETQLTVAPAERVEVVVDGNRRACLALSPEAPPVWLEGETRAGATVYAVPRVDIYTVLALASSRSQLEPLFQTHTAAASWTIPPVTAPLRQVLADWQPFGKGFVTDTANPHGGRQAVRCESDSLAEVSGLRQQVDVQQKAPQPIVIQAWSRTENVSGKADPRYSIYVDATCADGSMLRSLNASFPTGTHSWSEATLKIAAGKPIRVLTVHLLFRGHTGRVWFDDVSVKTGEQR
jgi:hypothetical protein